MHLWVNPQPLSRRGVKVITIPLVGLMLCPADVLLKPEYEHVRHLKEGTAIEVRAINRETNLDYKCIFIVNKDSNKA